VSRTSAHAFTPWWASLERSGRPRHMHTHRYRVYSSLKTKHTYRCCRNQLASWGGRSQLSWIGAQAGFVLIELGKPACARSSQSPLLLFRIDSVPFAQTVNTQARGQVLVFTPRADFCGHHRQRRERVQHAHASLPWLLSGRAVRIHCTVPWDLAESAAASPGAAS
jgi:hypothetical protein